MTLTAIVALALAGTTVILVERRGEGLGTAIAAGAAVLGVILLLLHGQDVAGPTPPTAPRSDSVSSAQPKVSCASESCL
jgi:hypothetical protein